MRRGLTQSGQTFALERFRGTADEWVEELRKIWRGLAFPRSEEVSRQFPVYANLLRLIWAEREKVPARHQAYWTSEVMGSKPRGTKNKGMLFFCHSHAKISKGLQVPRVPLQRHTPLHLAPLVAYWWYAGKPYARGAAIAWNLFGMADLVNAFALGALTGGGGGGIVFPTVLIPVYGVPRALLTHSYSLIGLLRNTSRQPKRTVSLHYGLEAPIVSP